MTTQITRWIEFDTGHRVASHGGKCRNVHGHRYNVGVTIEGEVPDSGMVVDFGELADVLRARVHDSWDHRFLFDAADELAPLLDQLPGALAMPGPPTAENMAEWIVLITADALEPFDIVRVTVYETPKSVATWTP